MFNVHLHPIADCAAGEQGVLHAVPEVTPLRDIENRIRFLRRPLCAGVPWQRGQRACRKDAKFPASQHERILLRFSEAGSPEILISNRDCGECASDPGHGSRGNGDLKGIVPAERQREGAPEARVPLKCIGSDSADRGIASA